MDLIQAYSNTVYGSGHNSCFITRFYKPVKSYLTKPILNLYKTSELCQIPINQLSLEPAAFILRTYFVSD